MKQLELAANFEWQFTVRNAFLSGEGRYFYLWLVVSM